MDKSSMLFYNDFDDRRKIIFFRFVRFLKEKGIFSSFKYNVAHNACKSSFLNSVYGGSARKLFSESRYDEWINFSMVWEETPEGHGFWDKIHKEWSEKRF